MENHTLARALEGHLRAQLALLEGCRDRAVAARDWRLACAWTDHFLKVSAAMTATASLAARVEAAGLSVPDLDGLRLPALPALPEQGGGASSRNSKTTSGEISKPVRFLSSPACGGGGSPRSGETEGGAAERPPSASLTPFARHLPRKRGRIGKVRLAPRLRVKKKGGAPKGNANARRSGCHTAAMRDFAQALKLYTHRLKVQLALLSLIVPQLPQRVVYLIEKPTRWLRPHVAPRPPRAVRTNP